MAKKSIDWDLVERLAVKLGVSQYAINKWRSRQTVPHKWRPQLIFMSAGALTWADFENLDKQARKAA